MGNPPSVGSVRFWQGIDPAADESGADFVDFFGAEEGHAAEFWGDHPAVYFGAFGIPGGEDAGVCGIDAGEADERAGVDDAEGIGGEPVEEFEAGATADAGFAMAVGTVDVEVGSGAIFE